jgi:hypothetical protein
MLFMQPVLVNDGHALDRAIAAEVRLAEPQAAEGQPTWTGWSGTTLAQSGMDSRSPFGPNAVDHNDLTPPGTAPHRPGDTVAPPTTPNAHPTDSSSNTRIPPEQAPGQTDAGPPGASGTTTATPPTEPSTATPPTVPSTTTPATTPSTGTPAPTTSGAGNSSGSTEPGTTGTPVNPYRASSSTFPGMTEFTRPGGSGASNSE